MKRLLTILTLVIPFLVTAQPQATSGPGGDNPPTPGGDPVPLTGIEWLLLAGGALGARKAHQIFRKKQHDS